MVRRAPPTVTAPIPAAPPPAQALAPIAPGAQAPGPNRMDDFRGERRESQQGGRTVITEPGRIIVRDPGGQSFVRHNEVDRFRYGARDIRTTQVGNETRTIVIRPDGSQIINVSGRDGLLLRMKEDDWDSVVDTNLKGAWNFSKAVMRPMMSGVDVVIANEEDLQSVLGVRVSDTDVHSGKLNVDAYRDAASSVTSTLGPSLVAITLRESLSASDNGWSAVLWDGKSQQMIQSQRYDVRLVDRIGGGDSFAAGLIYGLATGRSNEESLRFAVAASALKQTIPGDFNRVSVAEVEALAKGKASGRVQR